MSPFIAADCKTIRQRSFADVASSRVSTSGNEHRTSLRYNHPPRAADDCRWAECRVNMMALCEEPRTWKSRTCMAQSMAGVLPSCCTRKEVQFLADRPANGPELHRKAQAAAVFCGGCLLTFSTVASWARLSCIRTVARTSACILTVAEEKSLLWWMCQRGG